MAKVSFFKFNSPFSIFNFQLPMLRVYRASAGAGKTFALTMEYFKIVFNASSEYKNVLAVTFTNKATEEKIPYRAGIEQAGGRPEERLPGGT